MRRPCEAMWNAEADGRLRRRRRSPCPGPWRRLRGGRPQGHATKGERGRTLRRARPIERVARDGFSRSDCGRLRAAPRLSVPRRHRGEEPRSFPVSARRRGRRCGGLRAVTVSFLGPLLLRASARGTGGRLLSLLRRRLARPHPVSLRGDAACLPSSVFPPPTRLRRTRTGLSWTGSLRPGPSRTGRAPATPRSRHETRGRHRAAPLAAPSRAPLHGIQGNHRQRAS